MNTTVIHKELLKTLEYVARVSVKHVTLPVLQCVQMEVKDSTLTLRATNLEIGIEGTLAVKENKEDGVVVVPATLLLQTVSFLDQREVDLVTEGDVLIVKTPTSESRIATVSGEDFPRIQKIETDGQPIKGKVFALGIKTAVFAASQSSIKPELGSVYVYQKKEHTLTFVSTDSFRLVEKTVSQQNVVLESGILIPYKNAVELARICDLSEDDPTLYITENQCALTFPNMYITSRLVTGTFPDYESIIPKEYTTHTTLLAADLQNGLKKTNVFLNKFLRLTIEVTRKELILSSKSDEGETQQRVQASIDGEEIVLNFNQRYVQDIMSHLVDESLVIHFAGIGRPMVIESVHDRSLRYLVMPMNK